VTTEANGARFGGVRSARLIGSGSHGLKKQKIDV
jgi:hypothetical protein